MPPKEDKDKAKDEGEPPEQDEVKEMMERELQVGALHCDFMLCAPHSSCFELNSFTCSGDSKVNSVEWSLCH